ncbi:hypothetical protein [Allosalinactinospora lopnorensis]|uniref:hypothetical protein n=1 Tax=Allosalinactinospora lopnorensis TaxID=1352348 RepID=UPI000623C771|nr:hypothetical protein [Allosalinactinospora lopnorensis]
MDQPVAWSVTLTDTRGGTHTSETHELSRPSCPEPSAQATGEPPEEPADPEPPREDNDGGAEPPVVD